MNSWIFFWSSSCDGNGVSGIIKPNATPVSCKRGSAARVATHCVGRASRGRCAPARPAPHVQGRRKGKKSVEDTPRRTRGSASRAGRGWPISHFHRAPAFRRKHLNIKKKAVCTAFLFVIDLEIRRRLPYTLRLPALLVSRIRPEDGIVDVVLESVSCSLRHIVIE